MRYHCFLQAAVTWYSFVFSSEHVIDGCWVWGYIAFFLESKCSYPTIWCQSLVLNCRQKVFDLGALRLCRGSWHSKNWQKLLCFTVFHISIWGAWNLVWRD